MDKVVDLEEYRKRRIEVLKEHHRRAVVKALIKHSQDYYKSEKEEKE